MARARVGVVRLRFGKRKAQLLQCRFHLMQSHLDIRQLSTGTCREERVHPERLRGVDDRTVRAVLFHSEGRGAAPKAVFCSRCTHVVGMETHGMGNSGAAARTQAVAKAGVVDLDLEGVAVGLKKDNLRAGHIACRCCIAIVVAITDTRSGVLAHWNQPEGRGASAPRGRQVDRH